MNRKKKINETLKKKLKKRNAKLHQSNKPKYISKAERARLAELDNVDPKPETADDVVGE
ncbi:DUF2986 domain-containing protein [Vibrio sp.]|nr:DUF2986 domain-containing protein [Vibrio sp.]